MPQDDFIQQQINEVQTLTARLVVVTEAAISRASANEEKLVLLAEKVSELPTKKDLEDLLTTTLAKHVVKGFWVISLTALGAGVTWLLSHLSFRG